MDIRKFFVTLKRKKPEGRSSDSDEQDEHQTQSILEIVPTATAEVACGSSSSSLQDSVQSSAIEDCPDNDIGKYIGKASSLSTERKKELLENCWIPPATYDFGKDAIHLKRKFNFVWLEQYSSWLVYSKREKGAFCKFCTLFPPKITTVRGVLGSFIIRPFCKFKNIHECCKKHMETHFHKAALQAAKSFLEETPVDIQINKYSQQHLEENKKIVKSIIACIVFCGSHDLALRGKTYDDGILEGLFKLRIDAGDLDLQRHFEHGKRNASYRSVEIQNEIINICGDVIKEDIIKNVKQSVAYSVLADETADISGTEQLSIGLRYFNSQTNEVEEAFVAFVALQTLDAKAIAQTIDDFLTSQDLDAAKCVGLGFDGCSTMSGKEGGVQAILKKKYTKALYFHCSSHKLNLVINDLNALPEIRNTVGTIKDIITFFRESILRRKLIPNISKLCETRWSEKHKNIRLFKEHFVEIMGALETLMREGNGATRKSAFQLHAAASKILFLNALILIAKYSAIMEPVVNVLQSISLDTVKASQHIKKIVQLFKNHRDNPENTTIEILSDATVIAKQLGFEDEMKTLPRIVGRQQNRNNHPAGSPAEYWRRSLVLPYLDSIINSLELRFAEENKPSFALSALHPAQLLSMSKELLHEMCNNFADFYALNIKSEIGLWVDLWKCREDVGKSLTVAEVLAETKGFFPEVSKALQILIALPCTTCTVERSFSSLRRIKTWLRNTMAESRLNGLALMSIHRHVILKNPNDFHQKVLEIFSKNPRRLCLK